MADRVCDRMHQGVGQIMVGMELAAWVLQSGLPSIAQIRARCECGRATAYRYRGAMQQFLERHKPAESRAA